MLIILSLTYLISSVNDVIIEVDNKHNIPIIPTITKIDQLHNKSIRRLFDIFNESKIKLLSTFLIEITTIAVAKQQMNAGINHVLKNVPLLLLYIFNFWIALTITEKLRGLWKNTKIETLFSKKRNVECKRNG